jgi:hypothetical protein
MKPSIIFTIGVLATSKAFYIQTDASINPDWISEANVTNSYQANPRYKPC